MRYIPRAFKKVPVWGQLRIYYSSASSRVYGQVHHFTVDVNLEWPDACTFILIGAKSGQNFEINLVNNPVSFEYYSPLELSDGRFAFGIVVTENNQ